MVGAGTVSKQGWTVLCRVEVDGHQRKDVGQQTQIAGHGQGTRTWWCRGFLKTDPSGTRQPQRGQNSKIGDRWWPTRNGSREHCSCQLAIQTDRHGGQP
jgi:hypothetical protein